MTLSLLFFLISFPFHFQSFLGFRRSAEIDIILDGAERRKRAELKSGDGKKEKYYLFYDGESVTGKVSTVFISFSTQLTA